jgi:hypothetical protein
LLVLFIRYRSGAVLYAWAINRGYKPAAALAMLRLKRGAHALVLNPDRSGSPHFITQIDHIYRIKNDAAALKRLKDGYRVDPEWTEVVGTSTA